MTPIQVYGAIGVALFILLYTAASLIEVCAAIVEDAAEELEMSPGGFWAAAFVALLIAWPVLALYLAVGGGGDDSSASASP